MHRTFYVAEQNMHMSVVYQHGANNAWVVNFFPTMNDYGAVNSDVTSDDKPPCQPEMSENVHRNRDMLSASMTSQ